MQRSMLSWIACLLLVGFGSVASAGYDINFFVGKKALDEDDWRPVEDQTEFGVNATFGKDSWPVAIATDLLIASDDTSTVETQGTTTADGEFTGRTIELGIGVRKIWKKGKIRPFAGGGVSFLRSELEFDGVVSDTTLGSFILDLSEDGNGVGVWVDAGVFWRIGKRFNLGVEARYSRGDTEIVGEDLAAGGAHLGLILGWGR